MQHNYSNRRILTNALCASALLASLAAFGAQLLPVDRLPVAPSVRNVEGASRVSEPLEYTAPQILVNDPEGLKYNADVNALVRFPLDGDGPFPVVLYLHGRHVTCSYLGNEFLSTGECDLELPGVLGPPIQVLKAVDSYKGYDYMARNLAAQGYVVISINANDVNDKDLAGNAGANERSQLILHHLDILREINRTGFYSRLNKPYSMASLRGKIDLNNIGLMGHSRGGQGVTNVLRVNKNRPMTIEIGGSIYPVGDPFIAPHMLKAVFALAPTNFDYIDAPDTNFAVLLPYCDGDVSNLQGAYMYDKSRYVNETVKSPKYQVLAMGANHNFYNTTWSGDDYSNADSHCELGREGNGRDTPLDQRRHGEFLMSSFFRLHLGNEQQFAPYWNGYASLPPDACPIEKAKKGLKCDERVHLSIQKPAGKRLVVDDVLDMESLSKNYLNLPNTPSGLDRFEFCNTTTATGTAAPAACPSLRTQATAGQLYVESDNSTSKLTFGLGSQNVETYDSVTFRAGIPVLEGNSAVLAPPNLSVTLKDAAGVSKSVKISDHSRALFVPPGDSTNPEGAKTLLNMVRIPLSAFAGLDFKRLESLSFEHTGLVKLQITDAQFQALQGALPPLGNASTGGATPIDGGSVGGGSTGGGSTTGPTEVGGNTSTGAGTEAGGNTLLNPAGGGSLGWLGLLMLCIGLFAFKCNNRCN